jgi:PAS domain S-box-containing protein/putative nucleotidyltransferase with HDIG domain
MTMAQDIAELKRRGDVYKAIDRAAMDGFWLTDTQGRFLDVNDAYCQLVGYSREELLNMRIQDVEAVESAEETAHRIRRIMEVGEDRFETRHRRKDGRIVDIEVSVNHMDVEGGRLFVFLRDITERKKSEDALRHSEERYRLLAENISDVIWVTDMNLRPTYISPSMEGLLGYSAEESMTRNPVDALTPASLEVASNVFAAAGRAAREEQDRVFSSKPLELEFIRKDCSTVWASTKVNFLRDQHGRPTAIMGLLRDVTERRQAMEGLRVSEERFRGLVESTSDIVWETDATGVYSYVSPGIRSMLGYEPGEVIGKNALDLWVEGETKERFLQIMGSTASPKQPFSLLEVTFLHKNGHPVAMETSGAPFFDDWGKLLGYRGIDRDVTERHRAKKRLEQTLEKLQSTMEGTIQAVTATVEWRDPFTAGHQRRVAQLACAMAREMGFSPEQIGVIRMAGLLHDIGKIAIPTEILSKPGRLSDIEMSLIRTHCQAGYDILKNVEFPWPIADMVVQHHERIDGSGYPYGLREDEILMEARILAVADVVEAMTAHRPYRAALGIDKALEEISQNSGRLYDVDVVFACLRMIKEKGFVFEEQLNGSLTSVA